MLGEVGDVTPNVADIPVTTGFNKLRRSRHGLMLFNQNDQFVGRSLDLYGEFSELESEIFAWLLHEGNTVVEVGANIGAHTVSMAATVGEKGVIFALEPQRLTFQTLCANVALNSLTNVYAYHAAAGRTSGRITVPELDPMTFQNFGGLSIEGHSHGWEVPVHTVDSLPLAECQLIKVDVEGMEEEVLAGATSTIERFRPALYLENDRREKSASLIRLVQSFDYRIWWHFPRLFNPANFAGDSENIFGDIISINLLCLPREREINMGLLEVQSPDDWPFSG